MSNKNKKSAVAQALLEMDAIKSAIKEESKKSLNTLLAEAVRDALREGCEDEDEKDYDVYDSDKDDADDKDNATKGSAKSDVDEDGNEEMENGVDANAPVGGAEANAQAAEMGDQEAPEVGADDAAAAAEGEGQDDWDAYSEYQTGDKDTYDLTGENDYDKVVKVYKLLTDTDNVVVKKTDDTIQLKDGAAGTEYVIDLGGDDEEVSATAVDSEETNGPEAQINESYDDIAGFNDEEDDLGDEGFDAENGSQPWDDEEESIEDRIDRLQAELESLKVRKSNKEGDEEFEMATNNVYENKKSRKPMKESKEVLFEVDLGYTDNYQDKDPIAGLSNDEPSKSGKSWHKGVPTGTKKPWAGETKSKGEPFKTTKKVEGSVNEDEMPAGGEMPVEEQQNVGGFVQQNSVTTSRTPNSNGRSARSMRGSKTTGSADPRYGSANESKVVAENKALKKQVKELTEAIAAFRNNLAEAYVTNANLGKITKLFVENTTSQQEKIDIVNRFANEAKTVKQSNALYESIKKELGKSQKTINMNESMTKADNSKVINENKVYKSDDLLKTIDFMNRVLNC